jgi:hypothetical protein
LTYIVKPQGVSTYAKFFTVVYHTRNPDRYDRVFRIHMPDNPPANNAGLIQYGGGDLAIEELPFWAPATPPTDEDLRVLKGSWLMIVKTEDSTGTWTPGDPVVQDIVGFYRVLDDEFVSSSHSVHWVTLQGNDFFLDRDDPADIDHSSMFAILLPDVMSVYERTMQFPSDSNWN